MSAGHARQCTLVSLSLFPRCLTRALLASTAVATESRQALTEDKEGWICLHMLLVFGDCLPRRAFHLYGVALNADQLRDFDVITS